MGSSSPKKTRPLSALAAIAAAAAPSRLGTSSPASSSPLVAAPTASQGHPRARSLRRLRRSLHACTVEGLIAEVVAACAGGAILTAWAIYLHASTLVTGMVLALSQLAQLFQFPAAWTTSWLGHRRACVWLVSASRQAMLPLIAVPFLPLSDAQRQGVLLGVAAIAAVLGVLGNNAWVTWMGELVPKRVRGRYFGRRTAYCTLGGALAAAMAGVLLDRAEAHGSTGLTLAALQAVGSLCGIVTTLLMLRQHDPRPGLSEVRVGWAQLMLPLRDPAMRGFLAYLAAWNFAVGVAGSFFALHMLRNLKMGYTLVAIHGTALALVRMLVAPVWGKLLDRLGSRPVLLACSFGISSIPFVWLFPTEDFLWPLLIDCLVAGVLWCGHTIASFNLPLAITSRHDRPFYLAAFSTISGLAFSVATLAGGLLAQALPDRFEVFGHTMYDLQVVFVMSGFLRLAAAFVSLRIEEPAARGLDALWAALVDGLPRPAWLRGVRVPFVALRARPLASNENGAARVESVRDKSAA